VGDILKLKQLNFGYDGLPIAFSGYITQAGEPVPSAYDLRFDTVIWGIDRLHENLLLRIDGLSPTTMLFNACFTVQSGRLDALDRAVHSAHRQLSEGPAWLRTLLFPSTNDGMLQTTLGTMRPRIDLFDSTLNHAQRRAIETIVKDDFGQVPFLITGPPGTGKTKTVVELAMQLLAQEPSAHLIVCAPSDSAADTLALRLSKYLTPQDLFRLISPARSFPEVPNTILPWCHVEDQFFSLPSFSEMMSKRIVVVTARDAEILHHARLINADLHALECQLHLALHPETEIAPRLHWSALIMDEAAQATEPESLLPLLVVAPPQGKFGSRTPLVVMVGDQNQCKCFRPTHRKFFSFYYMLKLPSSLFSAITHVILTWYFSSGASHGIQAHSLATIAL
jgi:helicase MOV-10